jgi:hypothetical protein
MSQRDGNYGDPCGSDPYPTPEQVFAPEIEQSRNNWLFTVTGGLKGHAPEPPADAGHVPWWRR